MPAFFILNFICNEILTTLSLGCLLPFCLRKYSHLVNKYSQICNFEMILIEMNLYFKFENVAFVVVVAVLLSVKYGINQNSSNESKTHDT